MYKQMIHILVVEDEEAHIELMRRAFESYASHFDLTVVGNLTEARTSLSALPNGHRPDLVITDLLLPDGQGIELLPAGGQRVPFPLVVMTSYGNEKIAVEAIKAGALDYIVKSATTLADMPHIAERAVREWEHIRKRKLAEEALRRSEARYRSLVENARDVIFTLSIEGVITSLNPAFETITGWSRAEWLGRPFNRLLHPDDESVAVEVFQRILRGEIPPTFELRVATRSGDYVVEEFTAAPRFQAEGSPAILGIARDITKRKQTEEALQKSEERFRQVISSISDHIYVTEITEDEQYANNYVSPGIEALTGYPHERFLADWRFWHTAVIHPDDKEAAATQRERLARGQDSEIEYRLTRPDGRVIWVRDSARAEKVGTSKIIYGVVSDITERKQLEEQLRQSQKMEAIGKLAGGVAHDFNNILTIILGNCAFILSDLGEDDPLCQDVQEIQKAGKRAASLTRQLLAFSRQQILQPKVLDLNIVVVDIEKLLRRLIGEDIDLVTVLEPDLHRVKVDPGQIEQVIMNLAINARDAMPTGGKLTIETANVYLNDSYTRQHPELAPGAYVMLALSDTGSGMDAYTKARIFDPFFTTKDRDKGTGLGLATVHGIVNQSGGRIWVYSEPGQGTVFKIYLPRVEPTARSASSKPVSVKSQQRTETILLVEDEGMVRELARRALREVGYTVLESDNGDRAHAVSAAYAGSIHLLLTDVILPGSMSGAQLAASLGQLRPEMKVLYMSGYTDNAIVHHGVLDSGTPFLQKPFTPDVLVRKVQTVLDTT